MRNYIKIFFWFFIGIFGGLNFSWFLIFLLKPIIVWLGTGAFALDWRGGDFFHNEFAILIISGVVGLVFTINSIKRFF